MVNPTNDVIARGSTNIFSIKNFVMPSLLPKKSTSDFTQRETNLMIDLMCPTSQLHFYVYSILNDIKFIHCYSRVMVVT